MSESGGAGEAVPMYERAAQLERTMLAWNRTLLALAVNGALLVRVSTASGAWAAIAGLVVLAVTLLAWAVTNRAYRRLRGGPAAALLTHGRFTVGAVAVIVAVGVLDLVAVALHR